MQNPGAFSFGPSLLDKPVAGPMRFRNCWAAVILITLTLTSCQGPAEQDSVATAPKQTTATTSQEDPLGPAPAQLTTTTTQETGEQPTPPGSQEEQHTNALVDETSPYLLMHAHNPVQWYPWGEEALTRARDENKLIFLSIGYSSCHWCHVMERESFMDEEIAAFLNENFVCIKVDREERPDIDTIYMTSLRVFNQMVGSQRGGGWPLTMFLTPEAKPFFGGTYFPARDGDRGAVTGFKTLAERIVAAWSANRDRVRRDADVLTNVTRRELSGRRDRETTEIKATWIDDGLIELKDRFDPEHGGFGFAASNPNRPKFPEPANLLFLFDVLENDPENEEVKNMLELTLDQMFQGGIYDHVGGGFHRYSVDRYWHIPHFEKMLYDNGQLLSIYARAYEVNPKEEYRQACEEIANWAMVEMLDPSGGFYSALDAESEGEEGKYYRWEKSELQTLLGDQFARYADVYRINESPNFESEYYAPQLTQSLEQLGQTSGQTAADVRSELRAMNDKLLSARNKRERPLTDIKILTGWNGLFIRGLADAGRLLEKPEYIEAATRAANFLLENSLIDGRLRRTYTDGAARLNAYLDDYAFLIDGLIALHQATGDAQWLEKAAALQATQDELFLDEEVGGYFFTSSDHESLLARAKNPTDGAVPSGNSVSASNLLYLAEQLNKDDLKERARGVLKGTSNLLDEFPAIAPRLLIPLRQLAE
ncbi:MAG: thioredoxin domain-containing protein [Pirellulaceae bacterium]